MLEICLVKELCPVAWGPSHTSQLCHHLDASGADAMSPNPVCRPGTQSITLWIGQETYRVTFVNQLHLQLDPNFYLVMAQKYLCTPWQPHEMRR